MQQFGKARDSNTNPVPLMHRHSPLRHPAARIGISHRLPYLHVQHAQTCQVHANNAVPTLTVPNLQKPLVPWVQGTLQNETNFSSISRVEILAVEFIFAIQTYA